MKDSSSQKIRSLAELPQEIPPPRDGWPALEARLRDSAMSGSDRSEAGEGAGAPASRPRTRVTRIAALAAALAAVIVGISIDRRILRPLHPARPEIPTAGLTPGDGGQAVAYITDPRFLRERAALLRSLDARLARLPPPTRRKVLESLATLRQSMRQIRQALGEEPGNTLLQALLIDTYQNEMQVLSTVQETSGGTGET